MLICCVTLCYNVTLRYVTLRYSTLCDTTLCHIMSSMYHVMIFNNIYYISIRLLGNARRSCDNMEKTEIKRLTKGP